jgi:hypothetical protein
MYDPLSSQALHELLVSPIPFAAAVSLSVASVITALIRFGGYFLPPSHQLWQLVICIFSLMASITLLGLVSSRNSMYNSPYFFVLKLTI